MKRLAAAVLVTAAATSTAAAQTTVWSVEPDNTKQTATPALGLVPGDSIQVDYFQTSGAFADGLNFFRVGTAPAPPAIYRHELEPSGAHAELYGADSLPDTVLPDSIAPLQQNDGINGAAPLTWYGFGQAEEVYVGLTPTVFFRQACRAELSTELVTPIDLGTVPAAPSGGATVIELTSSSLPSDRDIELHLFDGDLRVIPGHWSDRVAFFGGNQGRMHVALHPGTYYVALSDNDLVGSLPASTLLSFNVENVHAVMDLPGSVACTGRDLGFDAALRLTNFSGLTLDGTWTKNDIFEVGWFTFSVGSTQSSFVFCDGDQVPEPCPCGNEPGSRTLAGCLNSTGRGATLYGWGSTPFSTPNGTVFSMNDLPPFATALPFVGTGTGATQTLFGGHFCLDPLGTRRLTPVFADAAGDAQVLVPQATLGVALAGQTLFAQAAYRDVGAAASCAVNFTSGHAFRVDP